MRAILLLVASFSLVAAAPTQRLDDDHQVAHEDSGPTKFSSKIVFTNETSNDHRSHGSREPKAGHIRMNDTMDPEQRLVLFVGKLKSYINDTDFDVLSFENQTRALKIDLASISKAVRRGNPSSSLKQQLTFAKHMFEVMSESIEQMKYYAASEIPGHSLVYKLIELNVRVLNLYNSHGAADVGTDGYMAKLLDLHRTLYQFLKKFKSLSDVLATMVSTVNLQVMEAELTFEKLWNSISRVGE